MDRGRSNRRHRRGGAYRRLFSRECLRCRRAPARRALAGAPLEARPEWRIAGQAVRHRPGGAQGGRQNDALAELRAIGLPRPIRCWPCSRVCRKSPAARPTAPRGPIARVQLAAVDMLAPSRDKLTREQQLTLDRVQAEGLAALGSREKALQTYAALASRNPDNAAVQEGYARLLLDSTNPAELKQALERWRTLAALHAAAAAVVRSEILRRLDSVQAGRRGRGGDPASLYAGNTTRPQRHGVDGTYPHCLPNAAGDRWRR